MGARIDDARIDDSVDEGGHPLSSNIELWVVSPNVYLLCSSTWPREVSMEVEVPYMPSVTNLHRIFDAIQNAGAPDAFGLDFLKDLGFTSSNDRPVIKLLKFLGFLDSSGKPLQSYKEFMDQHKARTILAQRLHKAYDDLFRSDKDAQSRSVDRLKGWFKTKTGVGDAVAKKMATTFKSLASYADFSSMLSAPDADEVAAPEEVGMESGDVRTVQLPGPAFERSRELTNGFGIGFSYRIEIHLPDTTNVETYRSIFRAIREELQS